MFDKNKLLLLIGIIFLVTIGGGTKNQIEPLNPIVAIDKNSTIEKIAKEVTVRILTESAPGSGVTIDRQGKIYTILTCQHVVAESQQGSYRVLLPDGKIYPARLKSIAKFKGLDVATIEFESEATYRLVKLGDSQNLSPGRSVYASGFVNYHKIDSTQIQSTSNWGNKAFRFTVGKVGLIAPRSLPEGYSLGYTNEVELGMSGGPVFDDLGQLIAINGRLKYPIQGIEAFIFADGTKPSVEIFEQMEALSWAIPISKIR